MPTPSTVCAFVLKFRLDAVAYAVLVAGAHWGCRRYAKLRKTPFVFPRRTFTAVSSAVLVAIALAELNGRGLVTGAPAPGAADPVTELWHRLIVFSMAGVAIALILHHSLQIARIRVHLRTQIRGRFDAERDRTKSVHACRAKSDFLVTMSHEVRSPLSALLVSADFLSRTELDPGQRTYTSSILKEGSRLNGILNQVLDLRKIEEGRVVLDRLPFAPIDIARDVAELFSPKAQSKRLELQFEAHAPTGLLLVGDARRFRQVLNNLLDNAIKFTDRGIVALSISCTPSHSAENAVQLDVCVRDSGIGIEPELRGRIFESVFVDDAYVPERPGGIGLGLAIAHQLVELMGGRIRVESIPGRGAEFSFTVSLPRIIVAATLGRTDKGAPAAGNPRPSVLIVDDISANRTMFGMFLEQQGFAADMAHDGDEAVQMAAENNYDAILMDVHMPLSDGYTAARRIRAAEPAGRHALILAVTACLAADVRDKCLAAGMDEHFSKPLELRKFCRTLSHLLAARSLRPRAADGGDCEKVSERLSPPLQRISN